MHLHSTSNGVHRPSCNLVVLPEISTGISLDRVTKAEWVELLRVSADRAYFHGEPLDTKKLPTYVIKGDVVGVLSTRDGWLEVEYLAKKRRTKGWIRAEDTKKLVQPGR